MPLKLMYITDREDIAKIAEDSGVDYIFIDLEIIGKDKRQRGKDTVISGHSIEDVKKIRKILSRAELLVRVNPIHAGSKAEIERVIGDGADTVMLPFFKTADEVGLFIDYAGRKAGTCLLCETPQAVNNIDCILKLENIDSVHIGLNDLHIAYGMKFMFELLADGTVENLCNKFRKRGVSYGFGGIARPGQGALPAEYVIAEHYRLGSSMTILSRSFCNAGGTADTGKIESLFKNGVKQIREYETALLDKNEEFFTNNRDEVIKKVREITDSMR